MRENDREIRRPLWGSIAARFEGSPVFRYGKATLEMGMFDAVWSWFTKQAR